MGNYSCSCSGVMFLFKQLRKSINEKKLDATNEANLKSSSIINNARSDNLTVCEKFKSAINNSMVLVDFDTGSTNSIASSHSFPSSPSENKRSSSTIRLDIIGHSSMIDSFSNLTEVINITNPKPHNIITAHTYYNFKISFNIS